MREGLKMVHSKRKLTNISFSIVYKKKRAEEFGAPALATPGVPLLQRNRKDPHLKSI